MFVVRVLLFSAAHFVLWYASAVVAYGSDLDQVPTRSAFSNGAAALCSVLKYPHDAILRAVPNNWLQQAPASTAATVILVSSLLWGTAFALIFQGLFAKQSRNTQSPSAAS
jgi:hypothetical protein